MADHNTDLPDDQLLDVNGIHGVQSVAEILDQWKSDRTEERLKQLSQHRLVEEDEDPDRLDDRKCRELLDCVPDNFRPLAKAFLSLRSYWYSGGEFHDENDRPVPADEVKLTVRRFYQAVADTALIGYTVSDSLVRELVEAIKAEALRVIDSDDAEEMLAREFGIEEASIERLDMSPGIEWLVDGVLVVGQPAVIGGPSKTLKTSIAVDLAVSLATATPFLGRFPVQARRKTVMFSGESGKAAVWNSVKRVAAARGLDEEEFLTDLANSHGIEFFFGTVKLGSDKGVEYIDAVLQRIKPDVLVIDPVYLSLTAGGSAAAGNVFSMGQLLARLAAVCSRHSVTLLLVHHSTKDLRYGQPMVLEDLTQAGIQEFARQWFLINRRRPFNQTEGQSDLVVNIGGSAGHSSLWNVTVTEGVMNTDGSGRSWDVTTEPRGSKPADNHNAEGDHAPEAIKKKAAKILEQLPGHDWKPHAEVKKAVGGNGKVFADAVEHLIQHGVIERQEVPGSGGQFRSYRLRRVSSSSSKDASQDPGT